ncbi:MAG: glycoside hydrolase family 2 [Bacteroidetes bacterium]|nr:glycoside hydrolase family 2 [Bacteroidota bacterium]
MKNSISSIVLILLCISSAQSQYQYDRSRIENIRWTPIPEKVAGLDRHILSLDGNWDFSAEPEQGFYKKRQIQNWPTIEVPGEWVMQGQSVKADSYAGYFRGFEVPESWKGYRIILKCEAVYSECNIWINGKETGSHLGGFTPFEFDVTESIRPGKNTIALEVRSESLADTLSSASKYAVHPLGGITRSISILALPAVNLASYHVNTQFDEKFEDADLNVEITLANQSSKTQEVNLQFELKDSKGKAVVFQGEDTHQLKLGRSANQIFSTSFHVAMPLKWDCEHPNLYHLVCKVNIDGREVKTVNRRFGFRQVDVRGNQVFVNNRVVKLKGVCRHEVDPLRGRSLTGNQWHEDVKLFKEGNVNYIRTSHYPPDEALLEACDELGMFVEEEAPFCWAKKDQVTDDNYYEAILQPTLEMVERDKSHPSVIQWSLGNESHHFNELFQVSADLVQVADPSRPRIFSAWKPDGDEGYLEITNHHYPGPQGATTYKDHKRPITFDEYCHLNAYNRFELMTDPGLRDAWGRGLMMMWEEMQKTPAVLGGALWAGIDDSFFLPSGEAVGYGTWGPVDGWRRKKPEFWHMKKVYSPVKIELLAGENNEPAKLKIENRYLFSDLSECNIKWSNNGEQGVLSASARPGESKVVSLPFNCAELGELNIDVFRDGDVPVDQYSFDLTSSEVEWEMDQNAVFSWSEKGAIRIGESQKIKVQLSGSELIISDKNGGEIVKGFPGLMIIPLNTEGSGGQMTKETPGFEIFSPYAANRKIEGVAVETSDAEIRISLTESYREAMGNSLIRIDANGNISVDYNYVIREELNPRQWGMAFSLSENMRVLNWKKRGLWSVYPDDHIGRNDGKARLFYDHSNSGLAGPGAKPGWTWNEDQTQYGSNDFRSTKRNILKASLMNDKGTGITVHSGGLQHIRSWYHQDAVHLLVAKYDNPGAERFFRSHAKHWDKPLKAGDKIEGSIHLKIVNTKL